jgi:uncharacterized protein YjdB
MNRNIISIVFLTIFFVFTSSIFAQQRGYYDAPYTRYEAENGTGNGTSVTSYAQNNIAYEASGRTCVNLTNNQSREWTASAAFRGIVVRASGANSQTATSGQNVSAKLYINNVEVATLTFDASYGWKNLQSDNNQNYTGISNGNPRMRYDEQRYLHSSSVTGTIKIVSQGNLYLDFIEIEDVPAAIPCPSGYATWNGSDLQSFLNGNAKVYIPAGTYNISGCIDMGACTSLVGAGKWHTTLNWTSTGQNNSGLVSYGKTKELKDFYMNQTASKSRSNNHKGINGVWGNISDVWVEHFECGAWFGNYNGGYGDANADGMTITNCRFRNNYADGINFCLGTRNSTVSHSNFRNNGDDDMAIWPASDGSRGTCYNNTFEYNTAEHCWFASSCALYGGYGNKWRYIIVRDNYETGIRFNNKFAGYGYGDSDNTISNIDVIRCGTWGGTYGNDSHFGAIDASSDGGAGQVKNVKLSCIDIIDAMSEGIWIQNGNNYANVNFCGITVNGTAKEGTANDPGSTKSSWGYGFPFRFNSGQGTSGITQASLTATNRGGNANADQNGCSWTSGGSCSCATVTITGVTVSGCSASSFNPAQTLQLSATVQGTGGTIPQTVTWSSNSTNVATVSATGLVTAGNTAGTATITATSTSDNTKKATCSFTVVIPTVALTSVSISNASVYVNENITVSVTFNPTNATNKNVTFSITSGGDKLQLINAATGEFKGLAAGTAAIKVTSEDGNKTATATITVNTRAVTGITITPATATVAVNQTLDLTATVLPANATNRNVVWSVQSGSGNASVNQSGTVTGIAAGQAVIRATAQDGSGKYGEAAITVATCTATGGADLIVEDFSWTPANPVPGDHVVFTATVKNQGGTAIPAGAKLGLLLRIGNCNIDYVANSNTYVWSDQNKGDAGLPSAIEPCGTIQLTINGGDSGVAYWTASTANNYTVCAEVDDSGLITEANENNNTLTKTLTVSNAVAVSGVTISPKTQTVTAGAQVTFSAAVAPQNATNQNVTYNIVNGGGFGTLNGNVLTTTSAGTIVVRATSAADASKYDDATVTVNPVSAVTGVSVTPSTASVQQGNTQQFSATVTVVGGASTAVTWSVTGNNISTGTTINATSGLLSVAANETATTLTVTATSNFDASKKGTATVTVTPAPAVTGVSVTPSTASVQQGNTQQFSATVTVVGDANTAVTWSVTGNNSTGTTISTGGSLSVAANETATTLTVTATSNLDASKKGTATVTVTATDIAVTEVTILPKAQTVTAGEQVAFSATVAPQNATNQNVTYSIVSGGGFGILSENVLTTTSAGTIVVRATSTADASKYDDATVTINSATGFNNIQSENIIIAYGNTVEIRGIEAGEEVSVYNVLGMKIFSQKAVQIPMIINNLQTGIYIVFIENKNISAKIISRSLKTQ